MKILIVAPEVAPFVKVGGLADVIGSLPKELEKLGHDICVVCPLYGIISKDKQWKVHDQPLNVNLGYRNLEAKVWETALPDSKVRAFFLQYDPFFDRMGVYDGPVGAYHDNDQRFAFFNRASLNLCLYLNWIPDVIHCHDWTTGFIPVYLNTTDSDTPLGRTATVFTIHNLQHQGYFSPALIDFAGLPENEFRSDSLEANGLVNMLKGSVYHATKITTVSPNYAREIQLPEHGNGLNEVLIFRAADLIGVLNGIDTSLWDPRTDHYLPVHYSPRSLKRKKKCKAALQSKLGLEENADTLIFGVVSRLYEQKGLDLLSAIIPSVMANLKVQIALIGTGEAYLQDSFRIHAQNYTNKIGAFIGYNDEIAHLLTAGADCLLVPSRFEPCGLTQMYAMAYGTPPLVRSTGGLVDTVDQYVEGSGQGTGFIYDDPTPDALYHTLGWVCSTYYDHPREFRKLQLNGMKKNFSWNRSAALYNDIYRWAVADRQQVSA